MFCACSNAVVAAIADFSGIGNKISVRSKDSPKTRSDASLL